MPRITPTGKICTSCASPSSRGYIELDTMCCDCYSTRVVDYWHTMLDAARVRLRAARDIDADAAISKADKEF